MFSWEKMLALNGNNAPYLQFAYMRIRSIFRKGEIEDSEITAAGLEIKLEAPEETTLAKHLLNFGLVLESAAEEYRPNFLCNYLYDLAGRFTSFYENCPVLKSEPQQRASRLVVRPARRHRHQLSPRVAQRVKRPPKTTPVSMLIVLFIERTSVTATCP